MVGQVEKDMVLSSLLLLVFDNSVLGKGALDVGFVLSKEFPVCRQSFQLHLQRC